jgi:membrane protein
MTTASAAAPGRLARQAPVAQASKDIGKDVGKDIGEGIGEEITSTRQRLERFALFRVLESTALGFVKDQAPSQAAGMTYYGIFSLFPLLLLFMSLAGFALQSSEQAREQMLGLITGLLPQGEERLKDVVQGVIDAKGVAAGIGVLALLWGALGWFQAIDTNVNRIWGVSKKRSLVKGKLFALVMIAALGGVGLTSFVANGALTWLAGSEYADQIPGSVLNWQAGISSLSLLTVAGVFYVLFRYAPQRRVELRDVWAAALATALLWEATRRLLAFYLERSNMISGYGPIGAALALLFWLYIASMIILLGAELAYAIAKERRSLRPETQLRVIAPPGEQPTPKFAPQVGQGDADEDADENAAEDDDAAGTGPEAGEALPPAPAESLATVPAVGAAPTSEQSPDASGGEPSRDRTGIVALAISVALVAGSVLFVRLRDPRP